MKKGVVGIAAFCAGIFAMIVGVAVMGSGNGELGTISGLAFVGFGIWSIKWSLTNGLTAVSDFFKSKKDTLSE
jgi:hypothetical protein